MIQELDILMNDPFIFHFKELFEVYKSKHLFESGNHTILPIKKNSDINLFCLFDDESKYILDIELPNYIQQVKDIMKQNNFKPDDSNNDVVIELHYGFTKNTEIITSQFGIHIDDYGAINCDVITIIIYLDVKCFGGELVFYERKFENNLCFSYPSFEIFKIIDTNNPINSCKIVIFEGSIYHKPNEYLHGHRLSIVFQIPRKK